MLNTDVEIGAIREDEDVVETRSRDEVVEIENTREEEDEEYESIVKVPEKNMSAEDEDIEEEHEPVRKKSKKGRKKTQKTKNTKNLNTTKWYQDEKIFTKRAGRGNSFETVKEFSGQSLTPIECFESMFSECVVNLLVNMSNNYALQRNGTLNVSKDEMKVFLSILLLTGYMTPKDIRLFWELQSDSNNSMVANSMRRNRFLEIQKFLHLADNTKLPKNDKFAKVREYFQLLNSNYLKNFEMMGSSHVSVDESMVPYYGKHSTKQHIKGKPIRFGYKIWACATRNGYIATFEPYQGAKSAPLPRQEEIGLGAAVVLELASRLSPSGGPYNLYIDNFFTSLKLMRLCTNKNFGCTGTVRENRLEKCPVQDSNDLKKCQRGTFSYQNTDDVCVVKWNDNNIVTIASNCHGVHPGKKVDRIGFRDKKKSKISIDCPHLVLCYNTYMGGVDRFDENVASMRVSIKGKKWWYPLFLFGLDSACQNAWLLYKRVSGDNSYSYLNFRRCVVQTYCHKYGKEKERKSLISNVPTMKKKVQLVQPQHSTDEHKEITCTQKRCKLCHKATRMFCSKCQVALHRHCWYKYHQKKQ